MKLTLKRTFCNGKYTIGHLYDGDSYICDVIEDVDRGLTNDMPLKEIKRRKVKSQTAIPSGTYTVTIGVVSPKFHAKKYYKDFCGGRVPRLLDVPGFDGILIHRGATEKDSAGCLIVGYNKVKGMVVDTTQAFEKLYGMMKDATVRGENITIEIQRLWA